MNTLMVKNGCGYSVTENDKVVKSVVNSLVRNNTFCPNIERTIFNLSKNGDDYTLATTVFFADKTKVTVKNSVHDKISIVKETVKLSDGSTREVDTASVESREIGLAYALLKRMICVPDEHGNVSGDGFANFLRKNIKRAWNQPVEAARAKGENLIRKAAVQKNTAEQSAKKTEKPSLRKCVRDLSDLLTLLNEKFSK